MSCSRPQIIIDLYLHTGLFSAQLFPRVTSVLPCSSLLSENAMTTRSPKEQFWWLENLSQQNSLVFEDGNIIFPERLGISNAVELVCYLRNEGSPTQTPSQRNANLFLLSLLIHQGSGAAQSCVGDVGELMRVSTLIRLAEEENELFRTGGLGRRRRPRRRCWRIL